MNAEAIRSWLTARYDDDAEAARKAASLCGCHPPAPVWAFGDESTDGRIVVVDDPHPEMRRKLSRRWSGTYDGLFMAEHIARHDPARALAEVAAKRRRLERHAPGSVVQDGDETWVRCVGHEWVAWPCSDVIDDAQSWADRDDFPAELRLP